MAVLAVTNTFVPLTLAEAGEVNTNFQDVVTFVNSQVIQKDASIAFTAVPSGPTANPVSANQFTRKAYVDVPRYVAVKSGVPAAATTAGVITWAATPGTWTVQSSNRVTSTAAGFTVTETGVYMVSVVGSLGTFVGGHHGIAISVNGAIQPHWQNVIQPGGYYSGGYPGANVQVTMPLTAGDLVAPRYSHADAATPNLWVGFSAVGVAGTFA